MAIDSNSPITIIEGIGPSRAEALASIDVFNIFDLLRCTVLQLHETVRDTAPKEQVQLWWNMASMLQVEEVNPQWAEGLVRGGIDSIGKLASKQIEDIQTVLAKAKDKRLIPNVPTITQIFSMIRDAVVIQHTGVLTLTIRNPDGNPVVNATTSIGRISQKTDERGRVRLLRIPFGPPTPLRIEHEDYGTLIINNPQINFDHLLIGVTVLNMPNRGDDSSSIQSLSEYNGDELPLPGSQPRKEITLSANELREGDLLRIHRFYKSTSDVQLISMLRDYVNGEFIIYQYRVPISSFNLPPKPRDIFVYRNSSFLPFLVTLDRFRSYKIRRQLVKKFSSLPKPSNRSEMIQDLQERIKFFTEKKGFKGYVRLKI